VNRFPDDHSIWDLVWDCLEAGTAMLDGSFYETHNDRFWERLQYKASASFDHGGGDAAGTGGGGE
jgi:hypothetical protein